MLWSLIGDGHGLIVIFGLAYIMNTSRYLAIGTYKSEMNTSLNLIIMRVNYICTCSKRTRAQSNSVYFIRRPFASTGC